MPLRFSVVTSMEFLALPTRFRCVAAKVAFGRLIFRAHDAPLLPTYLDPTALTINPLEKFGAKDGLEIGENVLFYGVTGCTYDQNDPLHIFKAGKDLCDQLL